jgi:hypothetical protein
VLSQAQQNTETPCRPCLTWARPGRTGHWLAHQHRTGPALPCLAGSALRITATGRAKTGNASPALPYPAWPSRTALSNALPCRPCRAATNRAPPRTAGADPDLPLLASLALPGNAAPRPVAPCPAEHELALPSNAGLALPCYAEPSSSWTVTASPALPYPAPTCSDRQRINKTGQSTPALLCRAKHFLARQGLAWTIPAKHGFAMPALPCLAPPCPAARQAMLC